MTGRKLQLPLLILLLTVRACFLFRLLGLLRLSVVYRAAWFRANREDLAARATLDDNPFAKCAQRLWMGALL